MSDRIWSIGHGARPFSDFLALLRENGIGALADIRSFPGSRRHPHFGRTALETALATAGVGYVHLDGLGGRRRGQVGSAHRAIRVGGFRAYADHMESGEFRTAYVRLLETAHGGPTAFMCAETLWWRCHRRLLSDRLLADGWDVVHILGAGKTEAHRLWELARVEDERLIYDVGTLPLEDAVEKGGPRASRG